MTPSDAWHDPYVRHNSIRPLFCMPWLIHAWRDLFICVEWLIPMCNLTHSYLRRDLFICVTWLISMCDMTHSRWHDSCMCYTTYSYVIWLFHMWHDSFICDMTHSYVWHDSFTCVTWLLQNAWVDSCVAWLIWGDMTHSCVTYVWHDLFICITQWIRGDMTHSHVTYNRMWHDLITCDMTFMCDMTHSYVLHISFEGTWLIHMPHDSFTRDMTWSHVTWLIRMYHDTFTCVMTHSHVTCLIHM